VRAVKGTPASVIQAWQPGVDPNGTACVQLAPIYVGEALPVKGQEYVLFFNDHGITPVELSFGYTVSDGTVYAPTLNRYPVHGVSLDAFIRGLSS